MTRSCPSRMSPSMRMTRPGACVLSASMVTMTSLGAAWPSATCRPERSASASPRLVSCRTGTSGISEACRPMASQVPSELPSSTATTLYSSRLSSMTWRMARSRTGRPSASLYAGRTMRIMASWRQTPQYKGSGPGDEEEPRPHGGAADHARALDPLRDLVVPGQAGELRHGLVLARRSLALHVEHHERERARADRLHQVARRAQARDGVDVGEVLRVQGRGPAGAAGVEGMEGDEDGAGRRAQA